MAGDQQNTIRARRSVAGSDRSLVWPYDRESKRPKMADLGHRTW